MKTTFYIVRHAKSVDNLTHIISGQINTPLSEEGIRQAQAVANDLKHIRFDAAFSSDLIRANHTAKIIAKEHNLTVKALEGLRERHHGVIQGLQGTTLSEELQKMLDRYGEMDYKDRFRFRPVSGMETDEEVIGRFVTFLRETALAYPGRTVLVVAHGNLLRTLLVHVGFGTYKELPHSTIKNTGYFVLTTDGETFKVEKTVGIEKKRG